MIDWTILIAIASVIVTNLVTIITLYIHLDNKTENRIAKIDDHIYQMKKSTDNLVEAIRQDMREFQESMKDFHGRLCAIEERNKK